MAAGVQRALQSKSASAPRRHEQGLAVTSATLTAGGGGTSGLQRLHNNLGERALVGALAGGLAGGVTNGVLHPLDTVKVKLQLRGSAFKGPLQVLRTAAATRGGVLALWHGWAAACFGSSLSSSVFFGAYETAKAVGAPPPVATLVGNALSSLVLVPKEVVKSRLQAGAPGSTLHVFTAALRERGVRGLYAGYMSTLLRNAPSNVISFSAYEALKHVQLRMAASRPGGAGGDEGTLSPGASLATGAVAGALAATATHPLDLVKTRLMTQGVRGPSGADLYRGVASTLRTVVRDEGVRGLGRGLRVRLLYNVLFTSLGLTCFEAFKRAIRAERAKRRRGREGETLQKKR